MSGSRKGWEDSFCKGKLKQYILTYRKPRQVDAMEILENNVVVISQ